MCFSLASNSFLASSLSTCNLFSVSSYAALTSKYICSNPDFSKCKVSRSRSKRAQSPFRVRLSCWAVSSCSSSWVIRSLCWTVKREMRRSNCSSCSLCAPSMRRFSSSKWVRSSVIWQQSDVNFSTLVSNEDLWAIRPTSSDSMCWIFSCDSSTVFCLHCSSSLRAFRLASNMIFSLFMEETNWATSVLRLLFSSTSLDFSRFNSSMWASSLLSFLVAWTSCSSIVVNSSNFWAICCCWASNCCWVETCRDWNSSTSLSWDAWISFLEFSNSASCWCKLSFSAPSSTVWDSSARFSSDKFSRWICRDSIVSLCCVRMVSETSASSLAWATAACNADLPVSTAVWSVEICCSKQLLEASNSTVSCSSERTVSSRRVMCCVASACLCSADWIRLACSEISCFLDSNSIKRPSFSSWDSWADCNSCWTSCCNRSRSWHSWSRSDSSWDERVWSTSFSWRTVSNWDFKDDVVSMKSVIRVVADSNSPLAFSKRASNSSLELWNVVNKREFCCSRSILIWISCCFSVVSCEADSSVAASSPRRLWSFSSSSVMFWDWSAICCLLNCNWPDTSFSSHWNLVSFAERVDCNSRWLCSKAAIVWFNSIFCLVSSWMDNSNAFFADWVSSSWRVSDSMWTPSSNASLARMSNCCWARFISLWNCFCNASSEWRSSSFSRLSELQPKESCSTLHFACSSWLCKFCFVMLASSTWRCRSCFSSSRVAVRCWKTFFSESNLSDWRAKFLR